jgi:hypothetical protein
MTKTPLHVVAIASLLLGASSNICRADQASDEKAIRKGDDAYVEAYNKQDAKAIAAMWSPEAVYVDPETGKEAVGREEIEKEFADTSRMEQPSIHCFAASIDRSTGQASKELGISKSAIHRLVAK